MNPAVVPVRNPRTGVFDANLNVASDAEIAAAGAALRAAQPAWAAQPIERRGALLRALSARLGDPRWREPLQRALEQDTGRRRIAVAEIEAVASLMSGWAERAPALCADAAWTASRTVRGISYRTQAHAYGLVGIIAPWNFPFLLSLTDAVPALLAGCAVLLKPSEVTPRWIAPFTRMLADMDELPSVFGIVTGGQRTGEAVVDAADFVCFTGSVPTGRIVAQRAAARLIPIALELGGKDPLLVLASADLERAVSAALRGSVLATGQACQSIERIYVDRSLFAAFVERLSAAAGRLRLNWPDIDQGEIGPLIHAPLAATLERQLGEAVARGARVLTGGQIEHCGGGLWLRPTVIVDVDHGMQLMREETFGPIMPVMPFDDIDAAVDLANDSAYGLSAAIIAGSIAEAEAVACRLEAGAVSLNDAALTAFFSEAAKDSFKSSGLGASRMGPQGFERFRRRQALLAQRGPALPIGAFAEGRSAQALAHNSDP